MKKFFSDFKAFINKGNVMDMAVGVVIATAFGAITKSLVADVIMPLVSLATGANSVADWKVTLKPEIIDEVTGDVLTAGTYLNYGNFLQTIIDFLIIAFSVFVAIRVITKSAERAAALVKKKEQEQAAEEPAPEPEPSAEEKLLTEIRDLLKNK